MAYKNKSASGHLKSECLNVPFKSLAQSTAMRGATPNYKNGMVPDF